MKRHARLPMLPVIVMGLILAIPGQMLAQEATPGPASPVADAARLSPEVTNPFFPLASTPYRVMEGDFTDEETGETVHERVEERVLPGTAMVAGVEVTVVEVDEFADGELNEHTFDYYAQRDDGMVIYLGEDVDMYEDGELVSHEGAWRAGEGANQPGEFMPADPQVGMTFEQERAPGLAEDRSTVIEVDVVISVPAGDFTGCIRTEDFNPIDGATEFKVYCPGAGIVREESEEGAMELIEIEVTSPATPAG